jgi:hypothetical protein
MTNTRRRSDSYERLDERVTNLYGRMGALETTVNQGFHQIETSVAELSKELGRGRTTNWVAVFSGLGALLTLVTVLGYLTIDPVRQGQTRLEVSMEHLVHNSVPKDNFDKLRERVIEDEKLILNRTTLRESDIRASDTELRDRKLSERVDSLAQAVRGMENRLFTLAVRPHLAPPEETGR